MASIDGTIQRLRSDKGLASSARELKVNDIVVSKVEDGHDLLMVTVMPDDWLSLIYRGSGWNVQYAVARGASLAARKGGNLWYTPDDLLTLEYLETFRPGRGVGQNRPLTMDP